MSGKEVGHKSSMGSLCLSRVLYNIIHYFLCGSIGLQLTMNHCLRERKHLFQILRSICLRGLRLKTSEKASVLGA